MPTLEFTLNGPPISQNVRQREALHAWRATIRQAAELAWTPGEPPWSGSLRLTLVYFYENTPVNTEATLKPIQDALIGLVLNDNSQFTEILYEKKDLCGNFIVPNLSPVLVEGFSRKTEFIYVKIETTQPTPGETVAEAASPETALPEPGELTEPVLEESL